MIRLISIFLMFVVFNTGNLDFTKYNGVKPLGVSEVYKMELVDYFKYVESVNLYVNGSKLSFQKDESNFDKIMFELNNIFIFAREMPAFGVALHNETVTAIQNGVWLELDFNKTHVHNDMPFDSLLIKVDKDYRGFNIFRKCNLEYSGRCFYVDLMEDKSMENLYNICIEKCP